MKPKKHRLDSFVKRRAKELGWFSPHPAHALLADWLESLSISELAALTFRGKPKYACSSSKENGARTFELRETWDKSKIELMERSMSDENPILKVLKHKKMHSLGSVIDKPIKWSKSNAKKKSKKAS
jgi:hypothetical protein